MNFPARLRSLGCALLLTVLGAVALVTGRVQAQDIGAPLAQLTTNKYDDTEAALAALAVSGSPAAAGIVSALADGKLVFGGAPPRVFIEGEGRALLDPLTLQPVADAPPVKPVRVNNRIRRAIEAASGTLSLVSPDPAKRLEAAVAVGRSRDAAALPALDAALAKETDAKVKSAMTLARASILIGQESTSEADRIAAIATVGAEGNQDALAILRSVPADASPAVKDAAAAAISGIEGNLALWGMVQNVWYGLSLGSVLLLAAIGLAITFGVMGVINMAHGEMVMLGAYTTFVVQELIRTYNPGLFDWSLIIAIPLAFLFTGLIGVIIERTVIRFLYGRALETLLATWGISLILQQAIRTLFGPTNREVGAPSWMSGSFELGQMSITYGRLWIIVFAMLVFVALLATLRLTRIGLEMRAVTQNRRMAASMGIRTNWVDAMTFGLGSGIAGIAGVALSQIDNVSPNLGQSYIIDSFLVVVFGGVGNLWGTLVGAMSLGVANKLLEPYAGAVLGKIALLVIVILFIQKRPRGLFALKGRSIEA
ncbi:urea ABC transporter, permease protein UrtB [Ancylobacter novellus DSM 506]|uniref:Urea ABC transporter, permease protein UrtB n=1 Tax=Ancylobacter novellus (strain ATCC 8093 / DSM 506 / JCM 20403 / CCM 1077 / IAM 12100 / NBRC 12443 / NCIMB 10456) TaxID=639283 RepID=D7A8Y9_ANCN5|nr:urea ABC transporter permease subunit UrtB [Ancylobacter novellus]ADH88694.1 urea ABC transporter, permease protein UrtB [Ancylobacter novellus DSM 506]